MKDVLTITLHCTDNSGSSLQAFALQRYIESRGCNCSIINYCPDYLRYNGNKFKSIILNLTLNLFTHIEIEKKLKAFRENYLKVTPELFKTYSDLLNHSFDVDIVISGSDQLWNPSYACGLDDAYYLSFIGNNKVKKIAYAASVGKDSLTAEEIEKLQLKTKKFDSITVREKQIVDNIFTHSVQWVCDPVFLIDESVYLDMMTTRQVKDKYLLVYLIYENSQLLDKYIEEYRKQRGGKVIQIGGFRRKCDCDIHIKELDPLDFLSYIKYADYVVSSSFHATAFSILFNKEFSVLNPQRNHSRIESLLSVSESVTNRMITERNIVDQFIDKINYVKVNEDFKCFIDNSKKKLDSIILSD